MAQLNITLNQEEILQPLSNNSGEAFKKLLQESLNSVLKAESDEQLQAAPYERTNDRKDFRNGSRERNLTTRIGTITLRVPHHRNQPFETMVFGNWSRSEAALVTSIAEMVVNGVSTRKVSKVVETLCGESYSKSTVSKVCKDMSAAVNEFKDRKLTLNYHFLTIDATYFKVRENHRTVSKAFMIAYGTNQYGHREIIGFNIYDNESTRTWREFLQSLRKRGLTGVVMITSDAHEGLRHALSEVFPDVPWQRCQFHFSRNISERVPKKYQAGIRTELQEMFNAKSLTEARNRKDEILANYSDVAESAMTCLEEGFDSAMTVFELPVHLRRYYRTSNHIERLNKELKRRSRVVGIFPNSESLLRLMGAVLMEYNETLQNTKAVFSHKTMEHLLQTDIQTRLTAIALEQRKLLAAA